MTSAEQQRIAELTEQLHQAEPRAAVAEAQAAERDRLIEAQRHELARLRRLPARQPPR
ncbi:hypothetical protein [Nesterenkonia sp. Act20]|uniref:hypothetical protein n=1 Tax=Nesterenkonia sp. Act20 TaxID=1483432 RepID=UPI001C43E7BE|nr:hypothetical protein [Nesterenkonia sp. Act20]